MELLVMQEVLEHLVDLVLPTVLMVLVLFATLVVLRIATSLE